MQMHKCRHRGPEPAGPIRSAQLGEHGLVTKGGGLGCPWGPLHLQAQIHVKELLASTAINSTKSSLLEVQSSQHRFFFFFLEVFENLKQILLPI